MTTLPFDVDRLDDVSTAVSDGGASMGRREVPR